MKKITLISFFIFLAFVGNAFSKETGLTIYNMSGSSSPDQYKTVYVVLRQAPRKIKMYHCYGIYTGDMNDSYAVEQYFRKKLSSKSCFNPEGIKNKIVGKNNDVRYIYSFLQVIDLTESAPGAPPGFVTSAATYTIDANDDLGKAPGSENITRLNTYISHRELDNPTIASDRLTHNLSGHAIIQFPEIKK